MLSFWRWSPVVVLSVTGCGGASAATIAADDGGSGPTHADAALADATHPDATPPGDAGHDGPHDARLHEATAPEASAGDALGADALADATTSDGATDAGSDATHDSGVDACVATSIAASVAPGNVVVLFDQSDSMKQSFEGDGGSGGTKWNVSETAIVAAFSAATAPLDVGAVFYPTTATGNTCSLVATTAPPQIAIEPSAAFATDFMAHFSAPGWSTILGTPLVLGLQAVSEWLPAPSPSPGTRAAVLITDGSPTCDTVTADILAPVEAMFSRGVKTYVVGLPGSASAATLLASIAQAGGTSAAVFPSSADGVQAAFAQVVTATSDPCILSLASAPPAGAKVQLVVTDAANPGGESIPPGDGGDAWVLAADGMSATLGGATCATQRAGGFTSLRFSYGCQ